MAVKTHYLVLGLIVLFQICHILDEVREVEQEELVENRNMFNEICKDGG